MKNSITNPHHIAELLSVIPFQPRRIDATDEDVSFMKNKEKRTWVHICKTLGINNVKSAVLAETRYKLSQAALESADRRAGQYREDSDYSIKLSNDIFMRLAKKKIYHPLDAIMAGECTKQVLEETRKTLKKIMDEK